MENRDFTWKKLGVNGLYSRLLIAKLVNITPITLVLLNSTYNYIVSEDYEPTYNWGRGHSAAVAMKTVLTGLQ